MMTKLLVTQIRSTIGGKQKQRDSLRSLGLKRIGHTVERPDDAVTRGMIRAVAHLVTVKEVN